MKKFSSNTMKVLVSTMVAFLLFVGVASAHVTVKPNISSPSAWETYTIKIPAEKDVPTTKVTLKVPKGVEFQQYQPTPGWDVTTEKDSTGNVTTITWVTAGEGILAGQFQQFNFVVKNPSNEGEIAWDAFQYYKDGSIVEWTGDEGTDSPHSITAITKSTTGNTGHAVKENKTTDTAAATNTGSTGMQVTTLIIAILALILAIAAFLKRRK
jgi:LPXTG-motif cell wall-anchored protein